MRSHGQKRPGPDWEIRYQDIETGNIEDMMVFGADTIEGAIEDAKQSLTTTDSDWFEIVSVIRVGIPAT
jgi:hypothetical protein